MPPNTPKTPEERKAEREARIAKRKEHQTKVQSKRLGLNRAVEVKTVQGKKVAVIQGTDRQVPKAVLERDLVLFQEQLEAIDGDIEAQQAARSLAVGRKDAIQAVVAEIDD